MARRIDNLPRCVSNLPMNLRQAVLQKIIDTAMGACRVTVVRKGTVWAVEAAQVGDYNRRQLVRIERTALQALVDVEEVV